MHVNEALKLARDHERAGRLPQAETLYRQIVDADPGHHVAWQALGLLAFHAGDLPLAARCLEAAVAADGSVALYHRNLGELYRRLGRFDVSIQRGQRAVELAPADVDAHYNLGLAHSDAGDYASAVRCYRQAVRLDPQHGLSWNNLGSALERQGDKDGAEQAYTRAVAIDAQHAEAQNNLGAILSERGQLERARACFEAAVAARPEFVDAHYNLSSLKRYAPDDPHLAALERIYAQRERLEQRSRIRYGFALGKALDDVGQYDRAFAVYEEANHLQHALLPVDEAGADALLARIIEVFNADFFREREALRASADPGRTPIFIVGMPRSGTTLLEQILCSHASVFGAGELVALDERVSAIAGRQFVEGAQALSARDIQRLGDEYLREVWQLAPDSRFITDKMPANFFYLGLIHLALPHAKIIHAMRDPMDSCFSCYSRLFNTGMEFAYDQGALGRYYRRYITLMRHWHAVLPAGTILDLPYEQLVADTEGQARRVLDFVGLPWDANCLSFHRNERLVKTASVAQVRKPIYQSSVARWRHFAPHLRPLYELVREFRPAGAWVPEAFARTDAIQARHRQGIDCYRQQRFDEAVACFDQLLADAPDLPEVLNSKGFALQDLGRVEEARDCFQRALDLRPGLAMARLNLALAQLKLGEWEAGWENYETRWSGSAEAGRGSFLRPACPLPQWAGEADTAGQSLLVIVEQGFGDVFQFARFIELACQRFARVGFACSTPLLRLMDWSFGERVVMLTNLPASFDGWDWQCPLMSLPRAFRTRPDTVPTNAPYLRVPKLAREHWHARLRHAAPGRLRIGIAWAGRPAYQYDARRSLAFEQLAPLLEGFDVAWVSLQKWAAGDTPPLIPAGIRWIDWTPELGDFADTAALVANLDLVISIDSALVHLAGALDKPVWMLDRFDNEWRWLDKRLDSPWYPRLRILRQPRFGEWAPVIEAARAELRALAGVAAPAAAVPEEVTALYQRGIAAYQAGRLDEAIDHLRAAVARRDDIAFFHADLGEMCRQRGLVDEAVAHGERAVALDPEMAVAFSNLGIAHFDRGDDARAETCQRRALALDAGCVSALNNLGSIERRRQQPEAALDWYRRALAQAPDHVESLSNLGVVLLEQDRAEAALAPLERAVALAPNHAEALCNLGLVYGLLSRFDAALACLRQALQQRPDYPNAWLGLARNHLELEQPREAEQAARRAIELAPELADAHCKLGSVLSRQGRGAPARAAFARALALDPDNEDALLGLGHLELEDGHSASARGYFQRALVLGRREIDARFHLAQSAKVRADDDNFAALRRLAADTALCETLSGSKRTTLHFALGKCFDDSGRHLEAFPHFLEGCRLKRATLSYDAAQMSQRFAAIRRVFDAAGLQRWRGGGHASDVPVFVLGMPRSGTTLTEQILASHPEVFGAGELPDLMEIAQRATPGAAAFSYPDNMSGLTPALLTEWAEDYIERLRKHAPAARRITDKMPGNFFALGLIHCLLPNARIIHVRRNPVDTCLSNFMRLFNQKQEHSYDLAELGRYYADYARLMQHWRAVLPEGAFLEVQYEDIVADMEGQARRLVDFCELEWDDACLAFHQNERSIRTASMMQVRQPLYASSVERWRFYQTFLGPLLEGLGEFAPEQ